MRLRETLSCCMALALATAFSTRASAGVVTINFDEFPSPPVTCCYNSTGVVGPLVYPSVTVVDGAGSGYVLNGSGWANVQTSGYNVFSTTSGSVDLNFANSVSNLSLDVLNGTKSAPFTVDIYGPGGSLISSQSNTLPGWPIAAAWHYSNNGGGIDKVVILGDSDFGIDTVTFTIAGGVPEPTTWAMLILGMAMIGSAARRRRQGLVLAA